MKKTILSILLINFTLLFTYALPGFSSFIQDKSGEYVYYRDHSFERESYIGLLSYDDYTYQIRYYAPSTSSQPEKIVASLFTINPDDATFNMTGENVISADYTNKDDIYIVNYMHDLLYEFSKRRSAIPSLSPSTDQYINNVSLYSNGVCYNSEYPQFGGNVTITYDVVIPFFNIKRIEDAKKNLLFECVSIGKISSSEDTSFNRYIKMPEVGNVKINSTKQKKQDKITVTSDNQKITLDLSWEQKMQNMWVQNDDAIISMVTILNGAAPEYYNEYFIIRNLLESKDGYFINLDKCEVIFDKGNMRIYSEQYLSQAGKLYYGVKFLTLNAQNNYDYMSFAALKATYLTKRSYYDKIIKSYSNK